MLGYLVLEPDITESDMTNAIYLALTNDELRSAGEWIKAASKKFPNSENIAALRAWHLRLTGDIHGAETILENILTKNPNNLVALIETGINAYNASDTAKAKEYLKKAQIINAGGPWSETIEGYLGKL